MNDLVDITKKDLIDFVINQNSKRIRQTSVDFYRNATELKDFVAFGLYNEKELIGVTAGAFTNQFGITLVDEAFRNQGLGTFLLKNKINYFRGKKIQYHTLVAEDNLQSRKMCEKTHLLIDGITEGTRSSGKYNIYHYVDNYHHYHIPVYFSRTLSDGQISTGYFFSNPTCDHNIILDDKMELGCIKCKGWFHYMLKDKK